MTELVVKGDWACADHDGVTLCDTCRQVAQNYSELAEQAERVAAVALVDMAEAPRHWAQLARALCDASARESRC